MSEVLLISNITYLASYAAPAEITRFVTCGSQGQMTKGFTF